MKFGSILFLKIVIFLAGLAVLTVCLFAFPHAIISDQVGYYRPILLGMYVTAIPFFIALFQGFKLLNYINGNKVFSEMSVGALRTIKYCAGVICALYLLGMPFIFYVANRDDAPGVAAIGFVFIFGSLVVATASSIFQNLLQNVINIKNENELTV